MVSKFRFPGQIILGKPASEQDAEDAKDAMPWI